jgi:WXXGXW repeat (2 copies)
MRKAYLLAAVVFALGFFCAALPGPASAQVAVGISVRIGPPALPVYVQPACPGPDYIWTPGFWAWGPDGYYWVPGRWVLAPQPGLLWTPGWWGFGGGVYIWHPGYWGRHVGFYGGINYGFGYFGTGFVGGEWRGDHFAYNRAVTNVNINIVRNVYVNRNYRRYSTTRISYNGGPHGINARPTREQQQWDRERHFDRTAEQDRHETQARDNRAFRYSDNHGRPPMGATQRPGEFSGPGASRSRSRSNEFHPPANENRPRGNSQPQPNNRGEHPNYAPPRNQPRSGEKPRSQPAPHGNQGDQHNRDGGHDNGGHGHDDGRR